MTIDAKIKFVQGATVGAPGVAIIGSLGTAVTASNGANIPNSNFARYVWSWLDVPALSAIASGVISDGFVTSITWEPDVAGDYHLQLEAYGIDGSKVVDRRVFRVLLPSGRALPAFDAEAPAMNFGGQIRGWAPDMEAWFAAVESGVVGGFGSTIINAGTGTLNNVPTLDGGAYAGALHLTGAAPSITGLGQGADRRWIILHAAVNQVLIQNESGSSSALNRIITGTGAAVTIPAGAAALLAYDPFASRWRIVSASGGGGTVANDIAKSTGVNIDRVIGFTGIPFSSVSDGAAAVVGGSPVYNEVGTNSIKFKKASPWIDVTNYGADSTGVADSSAAFKDAHDAVGGAGAKGATILIPEGVYRLDSDWVIAKNVTIRGSGMTSGNGGTLLLFAAGKKLIFASFQGGQAYASPSLASSSRIKDLGIMKDTNARITNTAWTAATVTTVGTKRIRTAQAGELDDQRHAYLDCIKAGTTHATTAPAVPAHPDEFSANFVPGGTYYEGMLVRGTTDNVAMAADGSNLITTHLFKCTTGGVAGGTHPTWDTGGTTSSGACVFTAMSSSDLWVNDNGVIWVARSDAGILSFTRIKCEDLHIEGAGGPGIHIRGNSAGAIVTNANGWRITNCRIVHCGYGVMAHGGDAQTGIGQSIDVEGAGYKMPAGGGIGIFDSSGVGNLWLNCQVANVPSDPAFDPDGGGSHSYMTANSGLMAAVFVDCYAEGYGAIAGSPVAWHLPGSSIQVFGGANSAGFTDELYPARDGTKTEAQIFVDTGQGANRNGIWRTRINPTNMQDKTGINAKIASRNPVSGVMLVTGLALSAVVAEDASRFVILSGAANATYNGTFQISSVEELTTVASCTFAEVGATGDTITRAAGDFVFDGWVPGDLVNVTGSASNNIVNAKVTAVTTTVLTLDTQDLTPEGPVSVTLKAKRIYAANRSSTSSAADANAITWTIGGAQVLTYMGTRDDNGAVIQWAHQGYGSVNKHQLCHSAVFTDAGGWPGYDWWAITSNGLKARVCMAVPGILGTYGSDQAAVDDFGVHFPGKIWFGDPALYIPSIEFGTAAPGTKRHGQGSLCFSRSFDGAMTTPFGFACSAVGTPGTWHELFPGMIGRVVKAMADANQALTAAEMRGSIKTTGALTATRTLTVPHPASESRAMGVDFNNACTGGSVTVSTGTGTTVTIGAGNRARLELSPDGVTSIASFTTP